MPFSFKIISEVAARPRHSDLKQEAYGCGSGHGLRLRKPPDNKRVLKANNLLKAFTMKDLKAAAERQKHVTVINWMKENNFKFIGDNLYSYKTFVIKTKYPIIQTIETNEILSWRIGDFNMFNDHFTSVPKPGYDIGCIDIQTNRLCIETLISIIDLLS